MIDAREAVGVPCVTTLGPQWVQDAATRHDLQSWQRAWLNDVVMVGQGVEDPVAASFRRSRRR